MAPPAKGDGAAATTAAARRGAGAGDGNGGTGGPPDDPQVMMMQLQAQMALGGLLPGPMLGLNNPVNNPVNDPMLNDPMLNNPMLPGVASPPPDATNVPSRPIPAQRQPPGPSKGAVGGRPRQAQGRRSYSTPVLLEGAGVAGSDPATMDDDELKKRRRKESNRESARRSRMRKQAECDVHRAEIAALKAEVELLRKENRELRDLTTTPRDPA